MDEIVQMLQDKAGLSPDQAKEVAQALVDIIESKVPPEFKGIIGSILGQGTAGGTEQAGLGGLLGGLSGLFGGNKG
jgi:hypothetical protein